MLTGHLPYDADTPEEIALMHIAGSAKPPREWNSDIPEELERITLRAMEPDLRKRYQSAGEMLKALNACKKHLNQQRPLVERRRESAEKKDSFFGVGQDLTEEAYQRRRKRAKRVSYFTGIFSVGVFAILLFVFLWNFWLEDLFRTAERVDVPDFTGKSYEAVVNDKQYADYHFTVVYTVDPDVPDGIIIEQDPVAGKSRMRVSDGINVQLTVSTGVVMTDVPYVINEDYDANMLAAAVALHEGFRYQPDGDLFWKQSVGNENSYLFVTTRHLNSPYLDSIKDTMEEGEYLIIACRSFDSGLDKAYDNITVKKIPQMLLERCEFGKADYNLNIVHPPVYDDCDEEEEDV